MRFGRAEYYVAILGTPSTTKPWMLQFGGHHLAINLTFSGGNRVLTPSHLGAQPAYFTLESRTVRPLGDELDKAVALINALDDKQRQQATLGYAVADTVLAAGERRQDHRARRCACGDLHAGAKQDADRPDWRMGSRRRTTPPATARMREITSTLGDTYFAWSGPPNKEGGAYFRIQGPTLVIEYAPQALKTRGPDGTPEHIHTIYRDPTNDYGRKTAGQ